MNHLLLLADVDVWIKPLWKVALSGVAVAGLLFLLLVLLELLLPKLAAIARATAKETLSQPLFYVLMAVGGFLLVLFLYLPYNTFGEDIKMIKFQGFATITILSLIIALWTAGVSVAEEIEGRTALTLLSKPVGRREFILGKFLGILAPVALLFLVLGMFFLVTVSYKVVYDARESAQLTPSSAQCWAEVYQAMPGLALAFMEIVVLTAISVAISTRLPMLPNILICGGVFALGHLVPLLLHSAVGQFEIVGFAARLFATILPVLDHFNVEAAIAKGIKVPWEYVLWTGLYCLLYSAAAMLLALLMFEDRDLA